MKTKGTKITDDLRKNFVPRAEYEKLKEQLKFQFEQVMNAVPIDADITFRGNIGQYIESYVTKQQQELARVKQDLLFVRELNTVLNNESENRLNQLNTSKDYAAKLIHDYKNLAETVRYTEQQLDAASRREAKLREALEKAVGWYSRRNFLLKRLYEILPHPLAWTNEKMSIVEKVREHIQERRPACIKAALQPDAKYK